MMSTMRLVLYAGVFAAEMHTTTFVGGIICLRGQGFIVVSC